MHPLTHFHKSWDWQILFCYFHGCVRFKTRPLVGLNLDQIFYSLRCSYLNLASPLFRPFICQLIKLMNTWSGKWFPSWYGLFTSCLSGLPWGWRWKSVVFYSLLPPILISESLRPIYVVTGFGFFETFLLQLAICKFLRSSRIHPHSLFGFSLVSLLFSLL